MIKPVLQMRNLRLRNKITSLRPLSPYIRQRDLTSSSPPNPSSNGSSQVTRGLSSHLPCLRHCPLHQGEASLLMALEAETKSSSSSFPSYLLNAAQLSAQI